MLTDSSFIVPAPAHDYRVRVPESCLPAIVFNHLYTVQDAGVQADAFAVGIGNCPAGMTEWSAPYRGQVISVGWDWLLLHDGVVSFREADPRTNLCLTDAEGYDIPEDSDTLWTLIEGILWKSTVTAAVLGGTTLS